MKTIGSWIVVIVAFVVFAFLFLADHAIGRGDHWKEEWID